MDRWIDRWIDRVDRTDTNVYDNGTGDDEDGGSLVNGLENGK